MEGLAELGSLDSVHVSIARGKTALGMGWLAGALGGRSVCRCRPSTDACPTVLDEMLPRPRLGSLLDESRRDHVHLESTPRATPTECQKGLADISRQTSYPPPFPSVETNPKDNKPKGAQPDHLTSTLHPHYTSSSPIGREYKLQPRPCHGSTAAPAPAPSRQPAFCSLCTPSSARQYPPPTPPTFPPSGLPSTDEKHGQSGGPGPPSH